MKQARRWLLLAAALVLLPQAAYAQKKKPKGATPAAAPAGETPAAPADMDADQPGAPAAPAAAPAAGDTGVNREKRKSKKNKMKTNDKK